MNILIIEDEYSLADAVAETLNGEGFNTCIKTNGEDGEDEALTDNYDLILLDVMLPEKNGFDILRSLRNMSINTPIIMLTAKSEIEDKLNGLEHLFHFSALWNHRGDPFRLTITDSHFETLIIHAVSDNTAHHDAGNLFE